MSNIKYLLMTRMETYLTQKMITEVPSSDKSKVNIVKLGRYQASPPPIYVTISAGDQEDPEFVDGVVNLREIEHIGFWVPTREIGGGTWWWRRGHIEIGCFFEFSGYTEKQAAQYACEVPSRLEYWLPQMPVADLKDSYDEGAHAIFVFADTFFEAGGPPTQYIWRGSLKWQCLTHRPF
jgi:hypothetical protein